jgi:hypothetical protein
MKRPYILLSVAWLVHIAGWCLPVIKHGVTLPEGLPGWEATTSAFLFLFLPIPDTWYAEVLSEVSAVTTLLFLFSSPLVAWRGSRRTRRVTAWIAVSAFIINAHWFYSLWFAEMGPQDWTLPLVVLVSIVGDRLI